MTTLRLPFKDCDIIKELSGGSKRRFLRIKCNKNVYVIMYGVREELLKYVKLAETLYKSNVNIPHIYKVDDGFVLMEDLGDLSLYKFVRTYGANLEVYKEVIKALVNFQGKEINGLVEFSAARLWNEFLHFKEFYVPYASIDVSSWDKEVENIVKKCVDSLFVPMHRDFQSTNIYLKKGKVYFIDFQDMALGPVYFDLAALLFDPYVMLQNSMVWELVEYFKGISGIDFQRENFLCCGALRIMQALGAFVRLSEGGNIFFRSFIGNGRCRLKGILRDIGMDRMADSL